jgi:signal transduction histidine kinase
MRIIFAISFLLLNSKVYSQSKDAIQVKSFYFIDSNSQQNLFSIPKKKFSGFREDQIINIGYNKNATIWCSFQIKNNSDKNNRAWLCFDNNHLDSLQWFEANKTVLLGDRTGNASPYLICQAFELQLKPFENKQIFVRLKKTVSFMDFSYSLESEEYLSRGTRKNVFLLSFLMGIIFLLILINGVLLIVTKQKLYVWYIAYSFLSATYVMITTGFAKFSLFPDFLYFSELRIYSAILWFIALGAFLATFLELKKTQKRKFKAIVLLNGINFGVIIITLVLSVNQKFDSIKYFSGFTYFNFIVIIILLILASFTHIKRNKWNALYVLLAFLPQIIWALTFIFSAFRWIPNSINSDWVIYISLFEVVLFGYILSKNYIETNLKNNKLTQQILKDKELSIAAITNAQFRERSQIANLIHDQFGSKLTHILHLLALEKVDLAGQNVRELTLEMRDVSHQIMPRALEEGALISSLRTHIEKINGGLDNCKVELFDFDFPKQINLQLALHVYLISLELISNALKYASPNRVDLEFYSYPDLFVFQFTDDGIGFDPEKSVKGFGLNTIESRIKGMNGHFELSSTEGSGTIVQITIPV